LDALSGTYFSEAEVARAAFRAMRADLPRLLHDWASGQELVARGYEEDVQLAAQLNVSDAVPVLREGHTPGWGRCRTAATATLLPVTGAGDHGSGRGF
jgi:phosphosulfolactate phosphohydrolase-like enzyme